MAVKIVYLNHQGRPVAKANAGKRLMAKAALVGALAAGATAGGSYAINSLYNYLDYSNFQKANSRQEEVAAPQKAPVTLEEAVEQEPQENTPLPDPAVAKLYASNSRRDYAQNNVAQLKKKNLFAYVSEALVNGKLVYRTLVDLVKSKELEEAKVKQRVNMPQVDVKNLHELDQVIYSKVAAYNANNPHNPVDFNLARAIASCESEYSPSARSHKNALGLFQLIKPTADKMAGRKLTKKELFDTHINSELGVKYIGYLQQSPYVLAGKSQDERLERLLAAYNGGERAIFQSDDNPALLRYENPKNWRYQETREYVPKVMRAYAEFASQNS